MRKSVQTYQELGEAIDQDIQQRTKAHQATIARIKTAKAQLKGKALVHEPLVLLAHGDSWFDYPLWANNISLGTTDIIAQLSALGNPPPVILNVSHFGDAATDELSLPKQQRMIDALQDPANWLDNGKPDAILFSGGGNDVAGDQFCIYLDYNKGGGAATGLDINRFQKALGGIAASYLDLFLFRDKYAPGVKIIGHCYDWPVPNGAHPSCAGPWLKPSLDFCGWTLADGTTIVKNALIEFRKMIEALPANNDFFLVSTQGTLTPGDWANELHPYPSGFVALAQKFVAELRLIFPGRI